MRRLVINRQSPFNRCRAVICDHVVFSAWAASSIVSDSSEKRYVNSVAAVARLRPRPTAAGPSQGGAGP